jgi:hypothetical protein
MSQTPQIDAVRSVIRVGFIAGGIVLLLAGLCVSLLVVGMFVQPGGIGAEKLLGPIFGFSALVLLFAGGMCFYLGFRLKRGAGAS